MSTILSTSPLNLTQAAVKPTSNDPLVRKTLDCLKEFGLNEHLHVERVGVSVNLTGSFHKDDIGNFRLALRKLNDELKIAVNAPFLIRDEIVTVGNQGS